MSKLTDANQEWLLSFVSGQNFYNKKLKNSKDTRLVYTSRLKHYCDIVEKNPDELITFKLEGMQNPNTMKEGQAEDLLEHFLENNGLTPSAQLAYLTAVKSFYASTRFRALAEDVGENIEVPEAKKNTPSVEDCIELENKMTKQRDKFCVWLLESCPVRQGTLRKLVWKDIKPTGDKDVPYWLSINSDRLKGHGHGKYKGTKHIGFLHSYAVEKLEAYKQELKQREIEYNEDSPLFMAYNTNPYGSSKGSALQRFNTIFTNASLMAWKDLLKKRYSPHDFRDIISTILEKPQVKANVNLAKPLTSHKPTGIESIYANHSSTDDKPNEDHLTLFKMCLPYLIPKTTQELEAKLNKQTAENEKEKLENTKVIAFQQKQIQEINEKIELLYPKEIYDGETHEFKNVDEYLAWRKEQQKRNEEQAKEDAKKTPEQLLDEIIQLRKAISKET